MRQKLFFDKKKQGFRNLLCVKYLTILEFELLRKPLYYVEELFV